MKVIVFAFTLLLSPKTKGQTLKDFQSPLSNNGQPVQVIHFYPVNIQKGYCCHLVLITSTNSDSRQLTIVKNRGGSCETT